MIVTRYCYESKSVQFFSYVSLHLIDGIGDKRTISNIDRSKVRMELICDCCNAHQCVYSNKMVGAKGGRTKSDVEELQQWSEGGYMCGSKVPGDKFYVQRKLFCGDYIESRYYNHFGGKKVKNGSKGGRLVTGDIYSIWYSFQDVLSDAEMKRSRNIGGNNPLLICHSCFNSNIKIPTSDGSSNVREKQGQRRTENTRKLQVAVQRSNKKSRK